MTGMIGVIINPNAKKNRGRAGHLDRIRRVLGGRGMVVETPTLDAIGPALQQLDERGCRYIVADGGDGSLHWVVNEASLGGRIGDGLRSRVFVPSNGGTTDFIAKAIRLRGACHEIVGRLSRALARDAAPPTIEVPTVRFEGRQRLPDGREVAFRRIGFGNALAGYAANFYGPYYATERIKGPVQIAWLMARGFLAAAGRGVFRGPLRGLKPRMIAEEEHAFLRPLRAEVTIDGAPLRDDAGRQVLEHTVLQVASIPLNLVGILRVFPLATRAQLHVQAGRVSPLEMARIFPRLMTGRVVDGMLPGAFDGAAQELQIRCLEGESMAAILDGELYRGVIELTAARGPTVPMSVP